jgi:hypothetical protein
MTFGQLVPVPGIYDARKIDYDGINAINQSTLKAIATSPLHYQHKLKGGSGKTTVPLRLGGVAHCAVLEPDQLARRYAVWAPVDEKTGEPKKDDFKGKEYTTFAANAALHGLTVIKRREHEAALRIGKAIRSHPVARRYLDSVKHTEAVLVWVDKETGLPCKCRIDLICDVGVPVAVEMKTAASVARRPFETAYATYGYDIQAAFYHDGLRAVLGVEPGDKCIAVESGEPHDVVVHDLNEVIDVGRELYQELMQKVLECRRSGLWLGQEPTAERILRLPKWRDPSLADSDNLTEIGLYYGDENGEAP